MYRTLRWMFLPVAVTIVLVGCGKSTTTTATTVATTAATAAPTTAAKTVTVKTVTDPTLGTILVDGQAGLTLYHNTKEMGSTIVCTGACATTWPPLTVPAGTTPTFSSDLPGAKFGTVTRPDGSLQVTFANWPLYWYSGDSKPGDTKGQGIGGIWFAVTSAGTNAGAGASGPTTTAGGSSTTAPGATTSTTYSY